MRNPTKRVRFPRKWFTGMLVIGIRKGAKHYYEPGLLVYSYYTLNGSYTNNAYLVKCDYDGKVRSFQFLKHKYEYKTEDDIYFKGRS